MTVVLVARVDRRRPTRLATPSCPCCGTDETVLPVIRTTLFVYFRCRECRELLPERIPPVELAYGLVAHVTESGLCTS